SPDLIASNSSRFLSFPSAGDFGSLVVDEERGLLFAGARDHLFALQLHDITEHLKVRPREPFTECSNQVKILHHYNQSHLYTCATGAFHPICTYVDIGPRSHIKVLASLIQLNSSFVSAVRDLGQGQDDDGKLYFFFRETALEGESGAKATYSRVAQLCRNDQGGERVLVNRWSTFLKAHLVCSQPGVDGLDTRFDELQDVFVLPTKDPRNPTIYAAFTTSSSVFQGSAVCAYDMDTLRQAFLGPFSHSDGPNHRRVPYRGRVPYPRPGTCPGRAFGAVTSTWKLPDTVLAFARSHPTMTMPIKPVGGHPLLVRVRHPARITRLAVSRSSARDSDYNVLFLGTDMGTVLKVLLLPRRSSSQVEVITLEEMQVFPDASPIQAMAISSKRQELYIGGSGVLVQLSFHRCGLYGPACSDCCLARDPYCAWDGSACIHYLSLPQQGQDVLHGDPMTSCPEQFHSYDPDAAKAPGNSRVLITVENSSVLLECPTHSPQAELFWLVERSVGKARKEVKLNDRTTFTPTGLLLRRLTHWDAGTYFCRAREIGGFVQTLARVTLAVLNTRQIDQILSAPEHSERHFGPTKLNKNWYRDVMRSLALQQRGSCRSKKGSRRRRRLGAGLRERARKQDHEQSKRGPRSISQRSEVPFGKNSVTALTCEPVMGF
uniref:Sema domain, immunoglobulin domain (Ig), short basic domain, secreted, (semaphorin) 3B n=1 Tax=Eptatretus burgeri TaxID=7764 RepID=A0A8C4QRF8_EPTBU